MCAQAFGIGWAELGGWRATGREQRACRERRRGRARWVDRPSTDVTGTQLPRSHQLPMNLALPNTEM